MSVNNFSVDESMIHILVDTARSILLEENPHDLSLNIRVYARQTGTFFMRNHTVEKIPICQKPD